MNRTTMVLAAVVLGLAAMFTSVDMAVAASTAPNYVALGDSYSSGVGAGGYDPASGNCKRSSHAYPVLWSAEHRASSFSFVACSGAKTSDVLSNQLSSLSANTNLVTITIGGNDAGFASVMESCVIGSIGGSTACKNATDNAIRYVQDTLPRQLDAVYSAIRTKAPNAELVVMSYPRLYTVGGTCHIGIGDTSRTYLNHAADVLDDTTAKEAANQGAWFADVRNAFANHGICSSDWWLNSVTWPISDSYHPNIEGHANGYLPMLDSVTGAPAQSPVSA